MSSSSSSCHRILNIYSTTAKPSNRLSTMQDFFFVGIISAIALGVAMIKSIMFAIHLINLRKSNEIIKDVTNCHVEDARILSEDLRQQFLIKSRTRISRKALGRCSTLSLCLLALSCFNSFEAKKDDSVTDLLDKEYGVRYANACEACKFLAIELEDRFEKLGQTSQVIETGYQIDGPKKKTKYTRSELYFIESLDGVCEGLLKYSIHKERKDSNRFAKGMSQTFKTLHQLVDKGVKVDLGIPMELWDSPSAEITALKQQCEDQLEKHDDLIEEWYWGGREQRLQDYLCRDRVLNKDQKSCLDDPAPPPAIETEVRQEL